MKYLNSIKSHLYKEESLFESLSRFSEQTLKDIEYARSLRSDYTNKLLDRIFGYETVTIVDEEGKKISKRIPKQRIISFAPPINIELKDMISDLEINEKIIYDTVSYVINIEGYYILDPINAYVVSYKEILKHFESRKKMDMGEFPVTKKTMITPPAPEILKLMKDWSNEKQKERGWSKKKKMKAYKNLVNRYTEKEEIEVIDVDKVTGEDVTKWMQKNKITSGDLDAIKKRQSLYKVFSNIINNVDKKYKFKSKEEREVRKNYYLGLSENYSKIMSGFLTKGAYYMISRSAYDVAAMSTGQSWRSCMTIGKRFHKYILKPGGDISSGTLIIYLFNLEKATGKQYHKEEDIEGAIKKLAIDDVPIKPTMGRILIKPFYNIYKPHNTDDIVYKAELDSYGPQYLKKTLTKVANDFANEVNRRYLDNEESSHYVFHCGRHYDDTGNFQQTLLNWKGEEISFKDAGLNIDKTPYSFENYDETTVIKIGEEIADNKVLKRINHNDNEENQFDEPTTSEDDKKVTYENTELKESVEKLKEWITKKSTDTDNLDINEIMSQWAAYYDDNYYYKANRGFKYLYSNNVISDILYAANKEETYYFIDYIFTHHNLMKEYSNFYSSNNFNESNVSLSTNNVHSMNMKRLLGVMKDIENHPLINIEKTNDEPSNLFLTEDRIENIIDDYIGQRQKAMPHMSIVSSYLIAKCIRFNKLDLLERLFNYISEHAVKDKTIRMPLEHLINEYIPVEIKNNLKEAIDETFEFNNTSGVDISEFYGNIEDLFIKNMKELDIKPSDDSIYVFRKGIFKEYTINDKEFLYQLYLRFLEESTILKKINKSLEWEYFSGNDRYYSVGKAELFYFYFENIDKSILNLTWDKLPIKDICEHITKAQRKFREDTYYLKKYKTPEKIYEKFNIYYKTGIKSIKKRTNEFKDVPLKELFYGINGMDFLHDRMKKQVVGKNINRILDLGDEVTDVITIMEQDKALFQDVISKLLRKVTPAVFEDLKKQNDENKMKNYIKFFLFIKKIKPAIAMAKYYIENNTMRIILSNVLNIDEEKYDIRYTVELYKHILNIKKRGDVNFNKDFHSKLFSQYNSDTEFSNEKKLKIENIMMKLLRHIDDPNILKKYDSESLLNLLKNIPFKLNYEFENKKEFFNVITKQVGQILSTPSDINLITQYLGNNERTNAIVKERLQIKKEQLLNIDKDMQIKLLEKISVIDELKKIINDPSYVKYTYLNQLDASFHSIHAMNPLVNEDLNEFLYEYNNGEKLIKIAESQENSNYIIQKYILDKIKNKKWQSDNYIYEFKKKMNDLLEKESVSEREINRTLDFENEWRYFIEWIENKASDDVISKKVIEDLTGNYVDNFLDEILEKNDKVFNLLYIIMVFNGPYIYHLRENKEKVFKNLKEKGVIEQEINSNRKVYFKQYWLINQIEMGEIIWNIEKSTKYKVKFQLTRVSEIKDDRIAYYKMKYSEYQYDKAKDLNIDEIDVPVKLISTEMIKKAPVDMIKEMASIKSKLNTGTNAPSNITYRKKLFSKIVKGLKEYNPNEEELENIIVNILPCFLDEKDTNASLFNSLSGLGKKKLDYLEKIGFFDIYTKNNRGFKSYTLNRKSFAYNYKAVHIFIQYNYFYAIKNNPTHDNIEFILNILRFPNPKHDEIIETFITKTEELMSLETNLPVKDRTYYVLLMYIFLHQNESIASIKYIKWEIERHKEDSKIVYMIKNQLHKLVAAYRKIYNLSFVIEEIDELIKILVDIIDDKQIVQEIEEKWNVVSKLTDDEIEEIKLEDIWNI